MNIENEIFLLLVEDLAESYRNMLLNITEEDEFMDELRLSRIADCNKLLDIIEQKRS